MVLLIARSTSAPLELVRHHLVVCGPILRRKLTMFHISVTVISLRWPFISESPPTPLAMMAKISPSLDPYIHSPSVRLGGLGLFGASGPSPCPIGPWHCRQARIYAWRPAAIDFGVG